MNVHVLKELLNVLYHVLAKLLPGVSRHICCLNLSSWFRVAGMRCRRPSHHVVQLCNTVDHLLRDMPHRLPVPPWSQMQAVVLSLSRTVTGRCRTGRLRCGRGFERLWMCVYVCLFVRRCVCLCTRVRACLCVCIWMCMCVCHVSPQLVACCHTYMWGIDANILPCTSMQCRVTWATTYTVYQIHNRDLARKHVKRHVWLRDIRQIRVCAREKQIYW